ncbi:Tn3 family transposase [Streptomyces acidiscabies]|uniref:Tn3 family transposase n=1 Tax=Streptomyces acidiscabies TaxID=42234 RepID=UPI0038F7406D
MRGERGRCFRRGGGCRVPGRRGPGHRPGDRHPVTEAAPFRGTAAFGEAAGAGGQGPDAGAHAEGDRGPYRVLGGVVAPLRSALGQRPEARRPVRPVRAHHLREGHQHGPVRGGQEHPRVSGHELSYVANRHFSIALLNEAVADLVNAHARLNISQAWGDGTHMDTYLNNLLAETSVRYGKAGGIAYHHIPDTCIALFTHFIPCGVWEAVHIDSLFGEAGKNVIDWDLIESQFRHLTKVAVSVREGAISSWTLLKRLRSGSHKNSTCTAFREVGRVIRTVQLLRYLSDATLRRRVTAATNKVESFNRFSQWVGFGNQGVLADNDPVEQEKAMKSNALLTNVVFSELRFRVLKFSLMVVRAAVGVSRSRGQADRVSGRAAGGR